MKKILKILYIIPLLVLATNLIFSWTIWGEAVFSFLPYVIGIYVGYMILLSMIMFLNHQEFKRINLYWINWLTVFFLFMGIYSFYFDIGAVAYGYNPGATKIVGANMWYKNDDLEGMEKFFKNEDADVLMLTEYTPKHEEHLRDYFTEEYPFKIVQFENLTFPYTGKAIYSKYPLILNELPKSYESEMFLSGGVQIADKEADLVMVHSTAPVNSTYYNSRNKQFSYLKSEVLDQTNSTSIITGDFNISPWSPRFIDINRSMKLSDKSRVAGNKFDFSWEFQEMPFFKSLIDHTFVSNDISVKSYELKGFPGSDHKAQVFTVELN
jgi:endonuclease/exonuclease/phosphatase (EEP) superfamily protein YafD